jgi:hypothetical protein
MKKLFALLFAFIALAPAFLFTPTIASAHEVYVLDHDEMQTGMQAPMPDFMGTIGSHLGQFVLWGIIVVALILIVYFLSTNRLVEKLLDPVLSRLKKYAPHIAQVTLGLALFASGYYHAIFGIELPLDSLFGSFTVMAACLLMILGVMLVFGIYPRIAAILTSALFLGLVAHIGIYMINYLTYLGEAITLSLFGGAHTIISHKKLGAHLTKIIPAHLHVYKFLIMRVCFGVSLIAASLYAKLFHGMLALEVVQKYNLTHYFPFDPMFLVLGAMLIENLLGLFFVLGFEIRFASIFFLIFLVMSLLFFGEAVWPHIILIGTALAMLTHGYDRFTFPFRAKKGKGQLEPVL